MDDLLIIAKCLNMSMILVYSDTRPAFVTSLEKLPDKTEDYNAERPRDIPHTKLLIQSHNENEENSCDTEYVKTQQSKHQVGLVEKSRTLGRSLGGLCRSPDHALLATIGDRPSNTICAL